MNTLKVSLGLLMLGATSVFAQMQTMEKPYAMNKNLSGAVKKTPERKFNPLYQRSIQARQISVVDNENTVAKKADLNATTAYEIKAFPNPFTTQIDVIITDGALAKSVYKAHLYDINGKRVYSETLTTHQSSLQVGQLSSGMYFLHVEKNGIVVKQEKFIKE